MPEGAVANAHASYLARGLVDRNAETVDSARIWPLIDALASSSERVDESRDLYVT